MRFQDEETSEDILHGIILEGNNNNPNQEMKLKEELMF